MIQMNSNQIREFLIQQTMDEIKERAKNSSWIGIDSDEYIIRSYED